LPVIGGWASNHLNQSGKGSINHFIGASSPMVPLYNGNRPRFIFWGPQRGLKV